MNQSLSGAVFFGPYRYVLWRTWNPDLPRTTFIMLNPSTADANNDDQTILRCKGHAQALEYGSLSVVNLYAYRSTRPRTLWTIEEDPIGPENNNHLLREAEQSACLIAAWGCQARARKRAQEVKELLTARGYRLFCLGLNQDKSPKHPGRLRKEQKLQDFL